MESSDHPSRLFTGGCGRTLGSAPSLGDGHAILSVLFFLPRTSSTASTRVLTLYHRESDPEEEDEEEEELPPKSDTFVNEAYDGKEVSSIWSRPWQGPLYHRGVPQGPPSMQIPPQAQHWHGAHS